MKGAEAESGEKVLWTTSSDEVSCKQEDFSLGISSALICFPVRINSGHPSILADCDYIAHCC